jgi:hypothetical protein
MQLPAAPEKPWTRSLHEMSEWVHDTLEAGGPRALRRLFTTHGAWPGTPAQKAALWGTYTRLVKNAERG